VAAFFAGDLLGGRPLTELWCASTIGAVTVWLQYQLGLLFLSRRGALWFALLFAFGTTEFSLASRNLFPHGLTLLLLSAALYALLKASKEGSGGYALTGFLLAAAFAVRPSNAISCVLLALYVAIQERRHLLHFLAGAVPVAILFSVISYRSATA
jgi:4-amino-4-deoxy-L-arabinose transferase-like glycosyltransferase